MTLKYRYLNPRRLLGKTLQIRAVEREIVDGVPRIVLYFEGKKKGLLATNQMLRDLTAMIGPHPLVEEFLRQN